MSLSFGIAWHWQALAAFYRLPPHTAMLVDRAVILLAERGEGQVDWDPPHHLLQAGFYDVVLHVDLERRVVNVIRIYRAR